MMEKNMQFLSRRRMLACMLAVLLLLGCVPAACAAAPLEIAAVTPAGMDIANIVNGGSVALGEGYTYYCNNGIWKVPEGGEAELLWEDYATALMLHDGYIYYSDGEEGDALFRRALEGGEKEAVVPFSSEYFCVSGEKLYLVCVKRLEHRGIYSCNLDGSDLTKISSAACSLMFVWQDYIYYADKDNRNRLVRMKLDGKKAKTIVDEYVNGAFINEVEEKIYLATNSGVIRCRLDGKKMETMTGIPAYRISVKDSTVIFSAFSYNANPGYPTGIFTIANGAEVPTRINLDQAATLGVGTEHLYYKSMNNSLYLMYSGFDGSSPEYTASGESLSLSEQVDQAGNEASEANNE